MAIRPAAEQQQIEHGQPHAVACGKDADEGLLVLVSQFLGIVEILDVDGEDLGLAEFGGDLVQDLCLHKTVVAVFVIKGDEALIRIEYLPLVELDFAFAVCLLQQSLTQDLRERPARHGDAKNSMSAERGILSFQHTEGEGARSAYALRGESGNCILCAQARCQLIDVLESVQLKDKHQSPSARDCCRAYIHSVVCPWREIAQFVWVEGHSSDGGVVQSRMEGQMQCADSAVLSWFEIASNGKMRARQETHGVPLFMTQKPRAQHDR